MGGYFVHVSLIKFQWQNYEQIEFDYSQCFGIAIVFVHRQFVNGNERKFGVQ